MNTTELEHFIAGHIATHTDAVWRPDGPAYEPSEIGIYQGPIGEDTNQGIGVTIYSHNDDLIGTRQRLLQLRFRGGPGDPGGANDLADATFPHLHGLRAIGGISFAYRISTALLGADTNGRQERTDNYHITLNPPGGTQ